jgi:hypothetical protein
MIRNSSEALLDGFIRVVAHTSLAARLRPSCKVIVSINQLVIDHLGTSDITLFQLVREKCPKLRNARE